MPKTQKSELKRKIDRIISAVEKKDLNSFSKDDVQNLIKERANFEHEVSDLRSRLDDLEETLNAIRTGQVDALVVSGPNGESIYSLAGADYPYRIMVETMGEGAVTINRDGTILFSNQSFAQLAGLSLEKIVGTNFTRYIDPKFKSEFKSLLDGNRSARLEISLFNRSKSVPVYLSISPLRENESGFSIVVTDLTHQKNEELMRKHAKELLSEISERKRAETALQKAKDELEDKVRERTSELKAAAFYARSLIEASVDPLVTISSDGKITDVNRSSEEATGLTREQLIGSDFSDYFTEPERARAGYEEVFRNGLVRDYPLELKHRDGHSAPVLYNAKLYTDDEGRIKGVFAAARDITKRKQAEDALKMERQRLYDVLETLPVYVVLLSEDYRVPFANRFFRERFGEDFGRRCYEYLFNRTEPCEICETFTVLKKNAPHHWEWTGPDGCNYDIFDFPFTDTDGSRMIMEVGVDITEIRKSENELRERTVDLARANELLLVEIEERRHSERRLRESRKKLRAMASEIVISDERSRQHFATDLHDTVVQTIGAAKLRSQLIQDKIPEDVKPIYSELQDFISQSITQARMIMAELSPPVLYELGFAPALEWLTEQIGNQHGIDIDFQAKSAPRMIHEIQVMLFQSTRELLMNVVKHANAETAVIKVSANGSKIKIEVKDDGRGFDDKQAFRTDVSGGGFGLFSIRERLRHFGGELRIRSKPGQGTKVTMTVPRVSNGS